MAKVFSGDEWVTKTSHSDVVPLLSDSQDPKKCVRLFVSGDRSQVGKSSTCLAICASLITKLNYKPEEIAYIKPATQCESQQLIGKFCQNRGIDCIPVGPIVFYSGFTRSFLAGETEDSDELLSKAEQAVNKLCSKKGRKIVIVDGVGYSSVGSICGVSNPMVSKASKASAILVCPKGVGNAIDSFNINRTYFESNGGIILGAIFNRFPTDGFYSIEKTRPQLDLYFEQFAPDYRIYGLLPEIKSLIGASPPPVNPSKATTSSSASEVKYDKDWTLQDESRLTELLTAFGQHVDVESLVNDAIANHERALGTSSSSSSSSSDVVAPIFQQQQQQQQAPPMAVVHQQPPQKKRKKDRPLSREEIVAKAMGQGASGGG